jgi:hypothetical protein
MSGRIPLLVVTLLGCGGRVASTPLPAPSESTEAAAPDAVALPPEVEDECARFNREQEELQRNPQGPCPYCPCVCQRPYDEIVCAPCAACHRVDPSPDEAVTPPTPDKESKQVPARP